MSYYKLLVEHVDGVSIESHCDEFTDALAVFLEWCQYDRRVSIVFVGEEFDEEQH